MFVQLKFSTTDDPETAVALTNFRTAPYSYDGRIAIVLDGELVADLAISSGDGVSNGYTRLFDFAEDVELGIGADHTILVVPYANTGGTVIDHFDFGVATAPATLTSTVVDNDVDGDGIINSLDTDSNGDGTTDREEVELGAADLAGLESGGVNADAFLVLEDTAGLTLDFNNVANVTDLVYVDMDGSTGQELTISDLDVLAVGDEGSLLIFGDEADTVNATGFTSSGVSLEVGGKVMDAYDGVNGTSLLVEEDVTVII